MPIWLSSAQPPEGQGLPTKASLKASTFILLATLHHVFTSRADYDLHVATFMRSESVTKTSTSRHSLA